MPTTRKQEGRVSFVTVYDDSRGRPSPIICFCLYSVNVQCILMKFMNFNSLHIHLGPGWGSFRKRSNFGILYFRPNSIGPVSFFHAVLVCPEKRPRQKSDFTKLTALCAMATPRRGTTADLKLQCSEHMTSICNYAAQLRAIFCC